MNKNVTAWNLLRLVQNLCILRLQVRFQRIFHTQTPQYIQKCPKRSDEGIFSSSSAVSRLLV